MKDNERFLAQLARHEGLRLKAYRCPSGCLTIGYGHNLDASPVPGIHARSAITRKKAQALLRTDAAQAEREVREAFPWVSRLVEARVAVLVNMAFNMGIPRLKGFVRTLSAIRNGHYDAAANAMMESRWASQVGRRAVELARQMRTGCWQEAIVIPRSAPEEDLPAGMGNGTATGPANLPGEGTPSREKGAGDQEDV